MTVGGTLSTTSIISQKMPLHLKKPPPPLLPCAEAGSIPFASTSLIKILQHFSITLQSPQSKELEETLMICEEATITGRRKLCATSIKSMQDFVSSVLGPKANLQKLTTTIHNRPLHPSLQAYTVQEIHVQLPLSSITACHTMPYPYAAFYCHDVPKTRVFKVTLEAGCHLDSSHWDTDHAAFKVLGTKPGSEPVCHFLTKDTMAWVSTSLVEAAMEIIDLKPCRVV
ncbi:hypothetical protein AMTRI_Chr13g125840 [Amborella trichopoda]